MRLITHLLITFLAQTTLVRLHKSRAENSIPSEYNEVKEQLWLRQTAPIVALSLSEEVPICFSTKGAGGWRRWCGIKEMRKMLDSRCAQWLLFNSCFEFWYYSWFKQSQTFAFSQTHRVSVWLIFSGLLHLFFFFGLNHSACYLWVKGLGWATANSFISPQFVTQKQQQFHPKWYFLANDAPAPPLNDKC